MTPKEQIKHMDKVIEHKDDVIEGLIELKHDLTQSLNLACSKVKQLEITIQELERKIYVGTSPD